jgi:DNA-binding FadR family transcriptional regulator
MTAARPRSVVASLWRRRATSGRSPRLSDRVVVVLAERIVNGEIGAEVPPPTEQEICAEFDVSKTTAREVIGALAGRGLVTVHHGRRMTVSPVAEWNHLDPLLLELNHDTVSVRRTLADLHDVRMLLEPEIAARAALRASDAQLDAIHGTLGRMGSLEHDPDTYLDAGVDFHSELAAACGNVMLAFVLDSVRELLRASRQFTKLVNPMPEATLAHRRIYEALVAREPEAAREAMRAHLLTVAEVWAPGGSGAASEEALQGSGSGKRRRSA